jgi:hypothetical protein
MAATPAWRAAACRKSRFLKAAARRRRSCAALPLRPAVSRR